MEINYTAKSMTDAVTSIYTRLYELLCIHTKLNILAMSAMQSMGYNGFKRWHRYRSHQYMKLKLKVRTEMYDKFRLIPNFKDVEISYSPKSMEEHLKSWESAILSAIQELGTVNKDFYETAGINCKIAKCAMCKMMKDYEKVGRYYKRFTESDWLTLDMHIVDDSIHEKFKKKEARYEYKGRTEKGL